MLVYKYKLKRLIMPGKVKLGCSIKMEERVLLDQLAKVLKMKQGEALGHILRNFPVAALAEPENSQLSLENFRLSSDEESEVVNALKNSDSQLDVIARDGLLQRSRYLNSIVDKQAQLETMSPQELGKATFKGAALFKIEQAIEKIVTHNNNQAEKSQKVCLTKGIVFKLTGSNRQTINKYFAEHEIMISDHNLKHELTDANNRKGKGFSFEQLLGVV
jgi:hypothetical protein